MKSQRHEGEWRVVKHEFKGMPSNEGIGARVTIAGGVIRIEEPNRKETVEFALDKMAFNNGEGDVLNLQLINDDLLRIYGDVDGGKNRLELQLVRVRK